MTDPKGPPERPGRSARSRPVVLGVSLKLYLDVPQTVSWTRDVARIAGSHPAVQGGMVRLFVLPSLPALEAARQELAGTAVEVGAQDLHWEDRGPFTGAVSGADLRYVGARFVEVGHAERRRLFGDDDATVRHKLTAAVRNDLVPVLCIGEREHIGLDEAVAECVAQLESALDGLRRAEAASELIVAYEPEWAIGGLRPASAEHITAVAAALSDRLALERWPSWVIYGGSAQPGLLTELGDHIDGLFLGRFAHDPTDLARIVDEAAALR